MRITATSRFLVLSSFAAAALVAACSDATAPSSAAVGPLAIDMATAPVPHYFGVGDTAQAVRCTPALRAIVGGARGAAWTGATIRWFMGTDRATPVDSVRISPTTVAGWWGDSAVDAADGRTISLDFTARLPFSAELSFGYRSDGRDASASVSFTCGPIVAPDTPEPTIAGPTLVAHGGNLHPGDTIQVRYAAAAEGTLWETYVALYGACNVRQRFPEMAQPTTSRVATFVIPAACHPRDATELGLAVVAFDAGDRPVVRTVGSGHYVIDGRLPTSPADGAPNDVGEHVPVATPTLIAAPTDRGLAIRYVEVSSRAR